MIVVRAIKYNSHYCLSSSHRAVSFNMHFINSNCLAFCHKSIKNIFTEVFSFNDHFFLFRMALGVECRQSVDSVCHFWDSTSDRSWIKSKHTCASYDRYLRSAWHKHLDRRLAWDVAFKDFLYFSLKEWTFGKAANHKYESYWSLLISSLLH